MTSKALSPEELDEVVRGLRRYDLPAWVPAFAERLHAHIAALEADNAALVACVSVCARVGLGTDSLGDPVAAQHAREMLAQPHPGAGLLERHAKALVRARNEGLEKAAEFLVNEYDQMGFARRIRAMKEPE